MPTLEQLQQKMKTLQAQADALIAKKGASGGRTNPKDHVGAWFDY
jgi:hypothetical protein